MITRRDYINSAFVEPIKAQISDPEIKNKVDEMVKYYEIIIAGIKDEIIETIPEIVGQDGRISPDVLIEELDAIMNI